MPDLGDMTAAELESLLADVRARMRPVSERLAAFTQERDLILTEVRRRQRADRARERSRRREAAEQGGLEPFLDLVAGSESGILEEFDFSLKTGGEVQLGFATARRPQVSWTDGTRSVPAYDLARCRELYDLGWEPGTPGHPGLRVHFVSSRQERLVDPTQVFARRRAEPPG